MSDAAANQPVVTVGLPVRNGARYLASAIEDILAQSLTSFELIIADNASTDATPEICAHYAARDARIRVLRHAADRGAAPNHNLLVHEARGRYFKWAAHDDRVHPAFLERCVRALEADPGALLCSTGTRVIDADGREAGMLVLDLAGCASDRPAARLRTVLRTDLWCVDLFGVFRTDALRQTRLFPSFIGSDRILRADLALRGKLLHLPEALFDSRDHDHRSTRALPAHHLRGAWYDPALAGRRVWPHCRMWGEYLRCVTGAPLPAAQRLRCLAVVLAWPLQHANAFRMLADLIIAVRPASWRRLHRLTRSGDRWLRLAPSPGPAVPAEPAP